MTPTTNEKIQVMQDYQYALDNSLIDQVKRLGRILVKTFGFSNRADFHNEYERLQLSKDKNNDTPEVSYQD